MLEAKPFYHLNRCFDVGFQIRSGYVMRQHSALHLLTRAESTTQITQP